VVAAQAADLADTADAVLHFCLLTQKLRLRLRRRILRLLRMRFFMVVSFLSSPTLVGAVASVRGAAEGLLTGR
jgi:hypothetical protein